MAIDVDGTLVLRGGGLNHDLVATCRRLRSEGVFLMLWSGRGVEHARDAAVRHDLLDLFDAIVPKPGYIVDDRGWSWTRFTKVLGPLAFAGIPGEAERKHLST